MHNAIKVELVEPEKMNLLGLMMGRIIERSILNRAQQTRVSKLRGRLGVTAGRMSVTIEFTDIAVLIRNGLTQPLNAQIKGSLMGLLDVSIKRQPIKSFLSGRISLKGNPLFAVKVLPLFYVDKMKD